MRYLLPLFMLLSFNFAQADLVTAVMGNNRMCVLNSFTRQLLKFEIDPKADKFKRPKTELEIFCGLGEFYFQCVMNEAAHYLAFNEAQKIEKASQYARLVNNLVHDNVKRRGSNTLKLEQELTQTFILSAKSCEEFLPENDEQVKKFEAVLDRLEGHKALLVQYQEAR